MHICFRANSADEHHREFTSLLRRLPGEGKIADLLGAYGTDQVFFTFPSPDGPALYAELDDRVPENFLPGGCNTAG